MAAQRDEEERSNRMKLLRAATDAFAEYGYDGTSLRTIADNAGVAFQLISYYFGSKEDLWKATVDHLYERYMETGQGLGFTLSGNIFEQFHNHLRLLLTDMLQRPQLRKIWIQEHFAGGPRYTEAIAPQVKNLHDKLALPYFKEVVRLGIVKKYTAEELALLWSGITQVNLVFPQYVELLLGQPCGSPKSIETQVDLVFRVLTDGAVENADDIDASARANVTTRYQDRLSRMETDIEQLKRLIADLGVAPKR